MVNLNIRIDENLKADVEAVLMRLGLTTSDAVRLFFAQIRNTRSIPFELKVYDEPNETLKRDLIQAEEDFKAGRLKRYESVDGFIKAMETED
ncbi:MAG: type II toxin-antitoxin system RelB/DinJ family antitoxin [Alphaproteobacteria bacterium]|nr:type II toxin-antitoxin system RelB/DinJ family antitoxin [Alphaproteobacteria bacterium]